ncbi:MAG: sulfurtransferase [Sandaracinus sp.]|nr:sulfurtransferase [Sandaracinus sp.]
MRLSIVLVLVVGCSSEPASRCMGLCPDDASVASDAGVVADAATDAMLGAMPDVSPLSPLVWSSDELASALAGGVQVVDTRALSEVEVSRIPGASRVDPSQLRTSVDGVPAQVPSASEVAAVFGAAGLVANRPIVVYGAGVTTEAARVVWTLAHFGHDDVHLLDGGFAAWAGETQSGALDVSSTTYALSHPEGRFRVDADEVNAALGDVLIVDARTAGEFDAGRIPGSLQVAWTDMIVDGAFRSREEIAALYPSLEGRRVITYCQTGSRASVTWVALIALGADAVLYDGSWAEWSTREDLPREP